MAAEGALCGFLYLEGSSWGSPEDTEPLAPGTLGIPEGLGKKNGRVSLRGGLKAGLDWATPFCCRLRPLVLTVLSLCVWAFRSCAPC